MCDGRANWKQNHSLQINTAAAVGDSTLTLQSQAKGQLTQSRKCVKEKNKNNNRGDYVIWTTQKNMIL